MSVERLLHILRLKHIVAMDMTGSSNLSLKCSTKKDMTWWSYQFKQNGMKIYFPYQKIMHIESRYVTALKEFVNNFINNWLVVAVTHIIYMIGKILLKINGANISNIFPSVRGKGVLS